MRAGIEAITEWERRRETDRAVVEGYRRIPATATEKDAAVEELGEQERLERYGAAYSRHPETTEEHCWAEDAAASLAQMYADG